MKQSRYFEASYFVIPVIWIGTILHPNGAKKSNEPIWEKLDSFPFGSSISVWQRADVYTPIEGATIDSANYCTRAAGVTRVILTGDRSALEKLMHCLIYETWCSHPFCPVAALIPLFDSPVNPLRIPESFLNSMPKLDQYSSLYV